MDFIDNSNKRNRDILEFSSENIIDDLKNDTIEKLKNFSPNIKGKEGIKFINKLKHDKINSYYCRFTLLHSGQHNKNRYRIR